MMISSRGRYALRVMIDLAENRENGYVPMKDVAKRQDISLKYIERIIPNLVRAGLVKGVRGKGGGYRLVRTPEEYTVGEVLRLVEGDFAPVACLGREAKPCERAGYCKALPMWAKLQTTVNDFFDGVTLIDLL